MIRTSLVIPSLVLKCESAHRIWIFYSNREHDTDQTGRRGNQLGRSMKSLDLNNLRLDFQQEVEQPNRVNISDLSIIYNGNLAWLPFDARHNFDAIAFGKPQRIWRVVVQMAKHSYAR